ncbi:hypothetical protein KAZ66_01790 [Candidatus Woesebacteria bacterium]|nr:hypothetical protein [Candidatus Woesebacteria bacterium]
MIQGKKINKQRISTEIVNISKYFLILFFGIVLFYFLFGKGFFKSAYKSRAAPIKTKIYGLGDSILVGQKDCTINPILCFFEAYTYLYLLANQARSTQSIQYINAGYGGTTAYGTSSYVNPPYKNGFINKSTTIPNTQTVLSRPENLTSSGKSGLLRANEGEFSQVQGSDVIISYGRNDVNMASISIDNFASAMTQIVASFNNTNNITLLTIPPMNPTAWSLYVPPASRRKEFDARIRSHSFPIELDRFFSAQIWELAYKKNMEIVPVHENLYFYPNTAYFSSDGIHPSSNGHVQLYNLIRNRSKVIQNTLNTVSKDESFKITGNNTGQIVFKQNGSFYYSEAFQSTDAKPFYYTKITTDGTVYATGKSMTVSNVPQDIILTALKSNYLPEEKLAMHITNTSRIKSGTAKIYYASDARISNYCSAQWQILPGNYTGNFFISQENINKYFQKGSYTIALIYTDNAGVNFTGNPSGSCSTTFKTNSNAFARITIQ